MFLWKWSENPTCQVEITVEITTYLEMVTVPWNIVYFHLHHLFLSISDISYVIINSIHVAKENFTCFTDPSYK